MISARCCFLLGSDGREPGRGSRRASLIPLDRLGSCSVAMSQPSHLSAETRNVIVLEQTS